MKDSAIIFDFDGTIADTHKHIIEISNRLAKDFKYKEIAPNDVDFLKGKTSQEVISLLKIPFLKIPAILKRAKEELKSSVTQIEPFQGVVDVLNELKHSKKKLGILSSNSEENIHAFLSHHGIDVFDFIDTTKAVWSKHIALKKVLRHHDFKENQILYIGDETRDITAAKKLHITIGAVTWGYNSKEALKKLGPDFIINSPSELLDICQSWHASII